MIHRDIKTGNILISRQGDVKLADFGIATSREEPDQGLTRDGTMLGTIAYTAPEQIDDARNVDPRSDIYSLGIVLYDNGRTPYPGAFTGETIAGSHRGRYLADSYRVNPRASRFLAGIARRCMRPKRSRRYAGLSRIRSGSSNGGSGSMTPRRSARPCGRSSKGERSRGRYGADGPCGCASPRRSPSSASPARPGWYAWTRAGGTSTRRATDSGHSSSRRRSSDRGSPRRASTLSRCSIAPPAGQLERLDDVDFDIHENPVLSTGRTLVLASDGFYLPAGRYRLKVSLENDLAWYSSTWSRARCSGSCCRPSRGCGSPSRTRRESGSRWRSATRRTTRTAGGRSRRQPRCPCSAPGDGGPWRTAERRGSRRVGPGASGSPATATAARTST